VRCPRCQTDNREAIRFCEECGARLELSCPNCGSAVAPDKKFCGFCGVRLQGTTATERYSAPQSYTPKHLAERILVSRNALEGERKQVTVLFADLKGSMELLADRDPEEARKLLDPVLERLMEAVHRFEGTVNQVMGDGIMALFGAPIAHEDHAVRACYAALRMQETVGWYAEELRRGQGVDVQIRVGINSGEVVVRSIGSDLHMDYTAVGQTTHLAARMEQLTRPGVTLVTGQTLRLAEGYVEVSPVGPVPVKGLSESVAVYELLGAGPVRSRLQASAARGLTPFVGREPELEQLRQTLERARGGHGQVVALVGEPGVGKSRLLWEFTHSHRTHGWLILESGAVSYGKLTSYLPVVDLLRAYFQIEDRDDRRKMREKVTGKLLTLDESLRPTLPAFLTLLDVPVEDPDWQDPDPPLRRRLILEAVKQLLLREAQVQPVLLVVENLQWADTETQAFLDSLVESLPTARFILALTYRPEYQHGWGGRSYYAQMRLDPLAPASAEGLLQALLGDDPSMTPVKQLLIERTEGNPFFLEECVRTLVETRVLTGERAAYRLDRAPTAIQVPATVQAVLASRIDRLTPEDKRLLHAASVIGKDVPLALIRGIAEMPEDALRESLARLQAAEFLFQRGLFPDIEYTFTHALTHDVAYASLLGDRRRALHTQILEAMETLYPERQSEQVEVLAHHAYRGEMWGKAVLYLRQAGMKASGRSANQEAAAFFEQALSALGHESDGREKTEQAIDLRLDLRPPLLQLGQLSRVLALSQQAENMAKLIGDEQRLARVYTYLINYHYLKGEPDLAIGYGERCLAIGETAGDLALQALARGYMGYSHHAQGHYREAEAILRKNVEMSDGGRWFESGTQTGILHVSSAGWLGFALAELGEFEAARACVDLAQRAADTANHAYGQTIAWTMTGLVALRNGDLDRALLFLVRSLEASREKALTVWRPLPSSLLGLAYVYAGRVPEGLALLEQGVTLSEELGVKAYLALWTANHAEGLLVAGQVDAARARAQEALDLALAHKERGHQAWTLYLLAEIAGTGERPDASRAEATYGQAAAIAEELGMGPLRARIALGLGRLHVRSGDRARAEDRLMTATGLFRDMDMRYWLEQAGGELKALGHVFVVAEGNKGLYDFLSRKFGEDVHVRVILDRRHGDRRRTAAAPGSERRRVDRRQKVVDAMLRSRGFAVVPDPPTNGDDEEQRAAKAPESPRVDPGRRAKPSTPRRPRA
jgi:class 3 adenylate cyclase/tetratricopeptide (TPR) repeat protein